ncbi:hypothetical protein C2R53_06970 [Helicobacter pylori]|nr:hypothetical protein [Helicobacter pylori]PUD80990.1 hypothetical protein C2R53_06970 [Helicobacter pylori]
MAFNHSTIQPFNQTIKQSNNQSINQPFNHSIIQPFNHSFNQRYCYNFYKNPFKNPLLFIIPPCINPFIPSLINPCHNIFKPFDSISPIFKSVGLTELNSIQGEDDDSVRRFKSA